MKKIKNFLHNRLFVSATGMIFGSIIYCFSVVFILDKGEFYAGGITGISQILANGILGQPMLKSVFVAVFNIPLFIIGWRSVSKRFAILSLASVGLQVALIALFQLFADKGFDPLKDIGDNKMILAVVGGMLCGAGCGIPLRCGSSTGGMDIVSQSFSIKTGIPFTIISGSVDAVIIIGGAIIGGSVSVGIYTIIRLIVHVITLDKIHTIYKYQKVSIITEQLEEIKAALIARFPHGITIFEATGAYTNTQKWVLESVVLTYELEEYRGIVKKIDPHAFVYHSSVKDIMGKFVRKAIS